MDPIVFFIVLLLFLLPAVLASLLELRDKSNGEKPFLEWTTNNALGAAIIIVVIIIVNIIFRILGV